MTPFKKFLGSLLSGGLFAGLLTYHEPALNSAIAIAIGILAMTILYGVVFFIVFILGKSTAMDGRLTRLNVEEYEFKEDSGFSRQTCPSIPLDEYGRAKFEDLAPEQWHLD